MPLLTRDGERAIARRIEDGERQILDGVLGCRLAVDALLESAAIGTTTQSLASEVLVDVDPRHARFDEAGRKRVLVEVLASLRRYRDEQQEVATRLDKPRVSAAMRAKLQARLDAAKAALLARFSHQWFRARLLEGAVEKVRAAGGAPSVALRQNHARIAQGVRVAEQARAEMLRANLRLVVSVAKKYRNHGVDLLDLVQEGNIGLMKAIDKFDHRRGFRLATYATWWIRVAVSRAISEQPHTIYVPASMRGEMNRIARATRELTAALGRPPGDDEIAERMGSSLGRVRLIGGLGRDPISLETPIGTDERSTLEDVIEDEHATSPAQAMYANDLAESMQSALSVLTTREAKIMRMRFGIGQSDGHTLNEISHVFGVTRERIRQIEEKALQKLRRNRVAGRLRPLLEG